MSASCIRTHRLRWSAVIGLAIAAAIFTASMMQLSFVDLTEGGLIAASVGWLMMVGMLTACAAADCHPLPLSACGLITLGCAGALWLMMFPIEDVGSSHFVWGLLAAVDALTIMGTLTALAAVIRLRGPDRWLGAAAVVMASYGWLLILSTMRSA